MKASLKQILKLFFLLEFFMLLNVFALKTYEHIRFYQFDLDNDRIFSESESSLETFETWELKYYSDIGENFAILISPLVSVLSAFFCFVITNILQHYGILQVLDKRRIESLNIKKMIISAFIFIIIGIIFFLCYSFTSLSENSILRIKDYLILILLSLVVFFITISVDIILDRFFKYTIFINIFWIFIDLKTFFTILYDIVDLKTDSFLYLWIPISGLVPIIIKMTGIKKK
jgi:hypothetical protein